MSTFLESKFEETFTEEMKVVRSPGVQDTHIHAAFLVLDPARLDRNLAASKAVSLTNGQQNGKHYASARVLGALDADLDLQVLRTLQGKTTVIPVISKADTITTKHMAVLKKTVSESLKTAGLDPMDILGVDDDDEGSVNGKPGRIDEEDEDDEAVDSGHSDGDDLPIQGRDSKRLSSGSVRRTKQSDDASKEDEIPVIPMSIISPDIYEPGVIGRQFPWGFADPYDEEHCDFLRLKETVFSYWRSDLREASREQWYEGWRTSRLKHRQGTSPRH